MARIKKTTHLAFGKARRRVEPATPTEEEEQPLPSPEEVETVSSPSFSDWSSSDNDSERNLEDNEDTAIETLEDSPCLEWWEDVERKAEEEEDEMLEEQETLLESFTTARKEERTQAAAAQAVHAESSLRGHGRVPACLQFPAILLGSRVAVTGANVFDATHAFRGYLQERNGQRAAMFARHVRQPRPERATVGSIHRLIQRTTYPNESWPLSHFWHACAKPTGQGQNELLPLFVAKGHSSGFWSAQS
jgi:hypothetical protein